MICTTNAVESLNSRIRRAVNARGHFPNEQAALKCVFLAIMSLDPTGKGQKRWMNRWKAPLNAFEIAFGDASPKVESNGTTTSYTVKLTDPPPRTVHQLLSAYVSFPVPFGDAADAGKSGPVAR